MIRNSQLKCKIFSIPVCILRFSLCQLAKHFSRWHQRDRVCLAFTLIEPLIYVDRFILLSSAFALTLAIWYLCWLFQFCVDYFAFVLTVIFVIFYVDDFAICVDYFAFTLMIRLLCWFFWLFCWWCFICLGYFSIRRGQINLLFYGPSFLKKGDWSVGKK